MNEAVIKVLASINEDILAYRGENLFDAGLLDSLQVIDLVVQLEDELDVDIDAELVVEDNFRTVPAIISLVERLQSH